MGVFVACSWPVIWPEECQKGKGSLFLQNYSIKDILLDLVIFSLALLSYAVEPSLDWILLNLDPFNWGAPLSQYKLDIHGLLSYLLPLCSTFASYLSCCVIAAMFGKKAKNTHILPSLLIMAALMSVISIACKFLGNLAFNYVDILRYRAFDYFVKSFITSLPLNLIRTFLLTFVGGYLVCSVKLKKAPNRF